MSDGFSGWKAGTKLFRFSWVLLITLMDTYCLSLVYYCNSWKRVLIYGLLFLDWQTEWMSLTIPMISFANFDKCLLIWSFYHFILDILPGTWVFNWSGVLGTIGAPSHWYRGVYNSPWIEPVKNEFLFTGGWPNRSLAARVCLKPKLWSLSFQRYVDNGKLNSFLLVASPILVVPLNVSEVFITSGLTCWQGRRIHIWRLKSLRHPLVHRGMCIWFSEPVKKLIFFSGQVAGQTLTTRDVCTATERLTKVVFLQWKPWFSFGL